MPNKSFLAKVTYRLKYWASELLTLTAVTVCVLCALLYRRITLSNVPTTIRIEVSNVHSLFSGGRFLHGDRSARFKIIEFLDYECPPCRALGNELRAVADTENLDISLYVQNFPISIHRNAATLADISTMLSESDFSNYHYRALSISEDELPTFIHAWQSRLNKTNPHWQSLARTKIASSRHVASLLKVSSTPSLFLVDSKDGKVFRCATYGDLINATRL